MSHRLVVNPGTPQVWTIELKPGVNRIGRASENDFPIQHSSISARHCEVTVTDAGVTLKDLGSANGTFVERVPVTEFQLHHRHRVQLGSVELVFESIGLPDLPDAVNLPADGARIMVANPGPIAPPAPPPPPPPPSTTVAATAAEEETAPASIAPARLRRGVVGALLGSLIGTLAWYWLIQRTGMEIGYAALVVGLITGGVARVLARQTDPKLGILCAGCALIAIIIGQSFSLYSLRDHQVEQQLATKFKQELRWAKSAVEATNRNEIVYFLAVREEIPEAEVSEEQINLFRTVEQPRYRDLLEGKPSRDAYIAEQKTTLEKPKLTGGIGLFTILWSCFGVAAAWWISASRAD